MQDLTRNTGVLLVAAGLFLGSASPVLATINNMDCFFVGYCSQSCVNKCKAGGQSKSRCEYFYGRFCVDTEKHCIKYRYKNDNCTDPDLENPYCAPETYWGC